MSEQELFSLPDTVTAAVIKYVKTKYGIHLYPELLIGLYGELVAYRRDVAKRARTDTGLKGADGFRAAMAFVMDQHYTQTNDQEQKLYKAICSGLARVGSELKRRRSKPKPRKTHTPLERLMAHVVVDQDNPQNRFAF